MLLEVGTITIVMSERRVIAPLDPTVHRHLGLELEEAKMVVLETGSNFQHFEPWRKSLIRVGSPGMTQSNLHAFNWTRVSRPMYPLDDLSGWDVPAEDSRR